MDSEVIPSPTPVETPAPASPPPAPAPKNKGGAVAVILALLFKFKTTLFIVLTKLKFLAIFGKLLLSGGSMILTMLLYSARFGWPMAVGFVLLIAVHEMGHVLALRYYGVKASVPIFVPFVGAFVALKEMPKNVKIEAFTALAGPVMGSAGAVVCYGIYTMTQQPYWLVLAYMGFMLNLFNLLPVPPLDGGRVVGAVSPWIWGAGILLGVGLVFMHPSGILMIMLVLAASRLYGVIKNPQPEYYDVPRIDRWIIGVAYFGLILMLVAGMHGCHSMLHPS